MKQHLAEILNILKTKFHIYFPYVLLIVGTLITLNFCIADLKEKTALDVMVQENEEFKKRADSAITYSIELNKQVQKYKKQAANAKKKADLAQKEAEESEKVAGDLKAYADSIAKNLSSSKDSSDILLPLKDKIIAQKDTTIDKQKKQISELNVSLYKKDTTITVLTKSRDSLVTVLSTTPDLDNCSQKIIFCKINKPSRRTSFVLGFGTAVALGVLTR